MRIANKDCGRFVRGGKPFIGNNLFAELGDNGAYVVYSYGHHFPLYAKISGKWYGNKDKYSVTTSKHKSQASPGVEVCWVSTKQLQDIILKAR